MEAETVGQFEEKAFLKDFIAKYALNAASEEFDDCIVIDLSKILCISDLPYLVYSIDHPSFIERPLPIDEETQYRFYGRWTAATICGDVLAMGAQPRGFSLDISAPLETQVRNLDYILQGVSDVLGAYETTYEGGNFDVSDLEMVGIAWGIVDQDKIIRRSGAREGDIIAVTTALGYGWAEYISRKMGKTHLLSRQTQEKFHSFKSMPLAPIKAILAAVKTDGITSGMDLSDGVIEFLYTILERNRLGTRIYEDWIWITPEMEEVANKVLNMRAGLLALEPGYDTPLAHAYTVNPDAWEDVNSAFENNNAKLYKIGVVTKEPQIVLETVYKRTVPIPAFWDDQFGKHNVIARWEDTIRPL